MARADCPPPMEITSGAHGLFACCHNNRNFICLPTEIILTNHHVRHLALPRWVYAPVYSIYSIFDNQYIRLHLSAQAESTPARLPMPLLMFSIRHTH